MDQNDLGFYTPSEWYANAVITAVAIDQDKEVQLETLPDYRNLYLSFATGNFGESLSDAYSVAVYIDGDFCRTITMDPLQPDDSKKYTNMEIGTFSAGVHTLEMTLLTDTEDADLSNNHYQSTFAVEDTGRGAYFQTYYGGDTYSLDCAKSFTLDYGKYNISGNFIGTEAGRKVNAQVLMYNSHNQLIYSAAVKNGKFKYKEFVLTKDTYTVYVLSTDNQKTADTITFSVSGDVFYKSDYGDNSIALVSNADRYTVRVLDSSRTLISNGWVGLGDTLSLRRIDFAYSGKYTFTVNTTDQVKVTLIQVTTNSKGQQKEKKMTSTTVSGKKKYGKDISFGGVLLERGAYYLQVEALKADKGTNADYSVKVSPASVFRTDCDNGDNNYLYDKTQKDVWNSKVLNSAAFVIDSSCLEDGKSAVQIDTDAETVIERKDGDTTFTNYIGFGDAMDFRKIELKTAAKLSFDISKTSGGAAKLVVYTVNNSGKMVVANSKLTVTAKAAATDGILKNQAVLEKGEYYIAMQSTDASKGKEAYYNVNLNANSVFYDDGDIGTNNFDSKTKKVKDDVMKEENALVLHNGEKLRLDGILAGDEEIDHDGYANFVGTGDESDIVRIQANAGMTVSLTVTAADAVNLVVYGLQKNGTLKALKTVKSKNNVAELVDFELKAKSAPGGQFYVGVTSSNAKKGSAAYYNMEVVSVSGQDSVPSSASDISAFAGPEEGAAQLGFAETCAGSALTMPETASVASALAMPETDTLGISDALSFGGYDTDALADASASALADLDDKSGWMDISMLA